MSHPLVHWGVSEYHTVAHSGQGSKLQYKGFGILLKGVFHNNQVISSQSGHFLRDHFHSRQFLECNSLARPPVIPTRVVVSSAIKRGSEGRCVTHLRVGCGCRGGRSALG